MRKEQKDKFDALVELSNYWADRLKMRVAYQWKIELAVWGLLIAATYSIKNRPSDLELGIAMCVIIVLHAGLWLRELHFRNHTDRSTAEHYLKHAAAILFDESKSFPADPPPVPRWRMWFGFLGDSLAMFEFATTLALAIIAYLYMGKL